MRSNLTSIESTSPPPSYPIIPIPPPWSVPVNHALSDQYAAIEALEQLITDNHLTGTIQQISFEVDATRYHFGAETDMGFETFYPHVPLHWNWEAELDFSFELNFEVKDRIRDLAYETENVDEFPENWTFPDLEPGPLSGKGIADSSRDTGQ